MRRKMQTRAILGANRIPIIPLCAVFTVSSIGVVKTEVAIATNRMARSLEAQIVVFVAVTFFARTAEP